MMLYVNGDSNSAGAELDNKNLSWPVILSNQLNFKLINQASGATGNPRILRVTQEFIEQNYNNIQDYFIIIGWTTWEREEWDYQGQYYNVNSSNAKLPDALQERYKNWVIEQDADMRDKKSVLWHDKIYNLHTQLKQQEVRHLFFNGFYNFFHIKKHEEKDWSNNFFEPYNNDCSYYWYLKKAGFAPTKHFHHLEDAQVKWAEVLSYYIKSNNLL